MQTFLPYASFDKSAQCLDNKRLGKQRVEAWQIYNTLQKKLQRKYLQDNLIDLTEDGRNELDNLEKIGWENHPAVLMWEGYEFALILYGISMCYEWANRGYKNTILLPKFIKALMCEEKQLKNTDIIPKFIGNEDFHSSHRSNLLRKDKEWYGQFKWSESDDLQYIWNVKIDSEL